MLTPRVREITRAGGEQVALVRLSLVLLPERRVNRPAHSRRANGLEL